MATSATQGKRAQRKRLYENLSCITVDADCGEYELKGLDYFDVPNEDYTAGNLTGARLVCEMLTAAAQDDSFDCLSAVLGRATELLKDDGTPDADSRRGAAVGFIGSLQDVFNYAAAKVDFTPIFKTSFSCYETELTDRIKKMRKANAASLASLTTNTTQPLEGASA